MKRLTARRVAALVAAVSLIGASLVGAVFWLGHGDGRPSPGAAPPSAKAVVPGTVLHVDSGVPATTFLPLGLPPQDGRTLSAQRAYDVLVLSASKLSPIPATVHPYYGLLTDPSRSPRAVHVRVWGFAVDSGCEHAASAAAQCRLWEFIDAWNGQNLGLLSEEVLRSGG